MNCLATLRRVWLYDQRRKHPARLQVEDNESFYLTFLRGTVGILSLDALELSPAWDSSVGDIGGINDHGSNYTNGSSASAGLGSGVGAAAKVPGARDSRKEVPLLGDAQWQRLRKTLEEQVRNGTGAPPCTACVNKGNTHEQSVW